MVWLNRSTTPLVWGGVVACADAAEFGTAVEGFGEVGGLVAGPVVGHDGEREHVAGVGVEAVFEERVAEEVFGLFDRGAQRGERVGGRCAKRHGCGEHDLGGVLDDGADPPRRARRDLDAGEVHLPHAVAAGGWLDEGSLAGFGECSAFGVVAGWLEQSLAMQGPVDRTLRCLDSISAHHRPDLSVAPC